MSNAGSRDFGLKTKGLAKSIARQKVYFKAREVISLLKMSS